MVAPLFQITLDETITEALSIRGRLRRGSRLA